MDMQIAGRMQRKISNTSRDGNEQQVKVNAAKKF